MDVLNYEFKQISVLRIDTYITKVQFYDLNIFAEYADKFSKSALKETKYLGFRDIPDLLQKYANGNKLLDYGCGPGISSAFLKKLGFQIDGVDINESMINLARQALPKNNFQVLKEGKIPAEDEHYDIVFSSWVLQEIGQKHELVTTLIEIARVLKTDGIFVAVLASEAFYGKNWIDVDAKYKENENLKGGDKTKILIKETNFFYDLISGLKRIIEKCYRKLDLM
ncbi:hypothetical protein V9T40_002344 [Parthenolecanium corni]|uniref:Methyltransferase type 11 domain-containing protein n=1 Tax=Parthenolecanium corni TaxID=536013 RepID=A0AAN9Y3Q7_9HEMI